MRGARRVGDRRDELRHERATAGASLRAALVAGAVAHEVRPGRGIRNIALGARRRELLSARFDGLGELGVRAAAGLAREERGTDVDRLALGGMQRGDHAGERRRQFDDGLRRLDVGDDLVELDAIADGDAPGDDLGLGEALTEVGQREVADHARHASTPLSEFGRPSTRSTPSRMRSRSGR